MARKLLNIWDELRFLALRRRATDALSKSDCLARHFALEGTKYQLAWLVGINNVEAGPVYPIAGRLKGMECVPYQ